MDIRAAIVEANTINIIQSGSHAILKKQAEVEEFCQAECIRLVEEAVRLGSTKASKHPHLNELPLWQYICALACENEFYRALERTAPQLKQARHPRWALTFLTLIANLSITAMI